MSESHGHAAQEEEPQSPSWLPALGLALFVAGGVAWSLCTGDSNAAASDAASASAAPGTAPPSPPAH
jgi:hypothetical protein